LQTPLRPPRPPHAQPLPWVWLLLLAGIAGVLRYAGNLWGLPSSTHLFSYHPDEYHSLRGAFALLGAGDPNPHFFNYGSLYLYLASAAAVLADSAGSLAGGASHLATLLHDWTLAARNLNMVCGVFTVLTVFFMVRRLYDWRVACVGGLAVAVMPLHVLHSHYATVDVPQALFIALTLLMAVRIAQSPRTGDYLLAGLCAGLAMSTKYNGALVILAPLVAHFAASRDEEKSVRLLAWQPLAMLVTMATVFAVTSPFTILDWAHARPDILFELQHMQAGEEPARSADPNGWLFHGQSLLMAATGAPVLALLGIIGLLRKRMVRPVLGPLLFGLLWFAMIGAANVRYQRYEMALVPLLGLLIAAAPFAIYGRASWTRLLSVIPPALNIGLGLAVSAMIVMPLMHEPDPRDQAAQALLRLVPPGRSVGLTWAPWFQSPAIDPCNGGLVLRNSPFWKAFQKPERPLKILGVDAGQLARQRPFAVVYSNFETRDALRVRDPGAVGFVSTLEEQYVPFAIFERKAPLSGVWGWQPPQDWLYAFPRLHLYMTTTRLMSLPSP
jgi:hypothetical protein